MQYDYFVASRYRNKPEILRLVNALRDKGKTVYSFIESDASLKHVGRVEDNAEEQMAKYEAKENWHTDQGIHEIFESDMGALKNSSALIMLLPAGKSVHIEAGAAWGLGKEMILIGEQKETESAYLIFDQRFATIEEFLKSL